MAVHFFADRLVIGPRAVIRIAATGLLIVALMHICDATGAEPALTAPRGYIGVRTSYRNNRLVIDAMVNAKRAHLAIDTGASWTTFDPDRAKRFGIAPQPAGPDPGEYRVTNGKRYPIAHVDSVQAGAMDFGSGSVGLLPLAKAPRYTIAPVEHLDGILGADVLTRYGAVINCVTETVYFKTDARAHLDLANFAAGQHFVRVPMREENGRKFTVPGSINGRACRLLVDTGAPYTLCNEQLANELGLRARRSRVEMSFLDGLERRVSIVMFQNFLIGDFHVPPQDLGISVLPENLFSRAKHRDIGAIVGLELPARNRAIIDFGSMNLFFE